MTDLLVRAAGDEASTLWYQADARAAFAVGTDVIVVLSVPFTREETAQAVVREWVPAPTAPGEDEEVRR